MNSTTGDGDRRAELLVLPPDRDLAGELYDKTLSFLIIVVLRSGSNLQPHVSEEPLMCHPRARQPPDHGAARGRVAGKTRMEPDL